MPAIMYACTLLILGGHLSGLFWAATGITPMFQLLKASLLDHDDRTSFSLLFANNTPDDVLLRRELDDLATEHPSRFKVGKGSKDTAE